MASCVFGHLVDELLARHFALLRRVRSPHSHSITINIGLTAMYLNPSRISSRPPMSWIGLPFNPCELMSSGVRLPVSTCRVRSAGTAGTAVGGSSVLGVKLYSYVI